MHRMLLPHPNFPSQIETKSEHFFKLKYSEGCIFFIFLEKIPCSTSWKPSLFLHNVYSYFHPILWKHNILTFFSPSSIQREEGTQCVLLALSLAAKVQKLVSGMPQYLVKTLQVSVGFFNYLEYTSPLSSVVVPSPISRFFFLFAN